MGFRKGVNMSKKNYIYTDIKQIHDIKKFLEDADIVFNSDLDAFSSDKMKQYATGNVSIAGKTLSPAMAGVMGSVAAGATTLGIGGTVGTIAGAGGIIGTGLTSSLVGGAAAVTTGAVALPVLLVALPVAAIGGLIFGGIFFRKRNREEKERLREELRTYQSIAKRQNDYITKYRSAVKKLQDIIEEYKSKLEEQRDLIEKLNNQIMQYNAIFKQLENYFKNLESDLKEGGVLS